MNRSSIILDYLQNSNLHTKNRLPDFEPAFFIRLSSLDDILTGPYQYRFVFDGRNEEYRDIGAITKVEYDEAFPEWYTLTHFDPVSSEEVKTIISISGVDAVKELYAMFSWQQVSDAALDNYHNSRPHREELVENHSDAVPILRIKRVDFGNSFAYQRHVYIAQDQEQVHLYMEPKSGSAIYLLNQAVPNEWISPLPSSKPQNIPGVPEPGHTQYKKPQTEGMDDIPPIPGDPVTYTATPNWWGTQTQGDNNE